MALLMTRRKCLTAAEAAISVIGLSMLQIKDVMETIESGKEMCEPHFNDLLAL
jgi:hypothetical protein